MTELFKDVSLNGPAKVIEMTQDEERVYSNDPSSIRRRIGFKFDNGYTVNLMAGQGVYGEAGFVPGEETVEVAVWSPEDKLVTDKATTELFGQPTSNVGTHPWAQPEIVEKYLNWASRQ
jgi:hypothetical protein